MYWTLVIAWDFIAGGPEFESPSRPWDFAFFYSFFPSMSKILKIMLTIRIIEYNYLNPTLDNDCCNDFG